MQVSSTGDGHSTGPIRQVHTAHAEGSAGAGKPARASSLNVDGVEVVGTQADKIGSLITKLKDIPSTREDVVTEVRVRLDQGEYVTRHAAERTAARILGSDAIT